MGDADLHDGEAFSMHVAAADTRVCVAFPAGERDQAACSGLGLEKSPPAFQGVAMAFLRAPKDWYTVAIKRLPADHPAQPTAEQAPVYASRLVKSFGASLPPQLRVVLSSVHSSVVQSASGAAAYDIVFDVSGTDDRSARVAHQHHVIVPVEGAEYAIAWASNAATGADLDDVAERAATTIRVQHPASGAAPPRIGIAAAIVGPIVVLAGALVWLRVRRQRKAA
jgi:hypothetical protein